MDIVPKNEFISLDTLEKYIEKYPEDAEKWIEFIRKPEGEQIIRRRTPDDIEVNEDLYKTNLELHTIVSDVPIEHYNDGCLFCKKSWTSTEGVPTMTLICGHKFHTVCSMIDQYNDETMRCIVNECDINTWDYVRKIIRANDKNVNRAQDILLDAYKSRRDFKTDLKEMKEHISLVSRAHGSVRKLIIDGKKEFINKHLHTLNNMQNDLNENLKYIKKSEQMYKYKSLLKEYRKKATYIFRKYHMSFRELRQNGLINISWRLRWVLERHRDSFKYHKLGFKMYPGKKKWKDVLQEDEHI